MRALFYVCPISIGMGLRPPALWAGEAPLQTFDAAHPEDKVALVFCLHGAVACLP